MSDLSARIAANVAAIRNRIDEACRRSDRSADDVTLVAVTKYAKIDWVDALVELGVTHLGESRPQQLAQRAESLPGNIDWHLIGHLQRNKVRSVLPHVALLHSVDSLRLARRINDVAGELSLKPAVLLETNVSGEPSKDGFDSRQLTSDWETLAGLPNLEIVGLMTMASATGDPESARPTFRSLRELGDRLRESSSADDVLPELSMGMSGDFEIAIEEGATFVRIGSSLFDGLESVEGLA